MTMGRKLRKRIITTLDPNAFDEGSLLSQIEQNEARMAADPEVQRIRAEVAVKSRREGTMLAIPAILFNAGLWTAIAVYLPGLVKPAGAGLFFCMVSLFIWMATHPTSR